LCYILILACLLVFFFLFSSSCALRVLHSFPTRRSSDLWDMANLPALPDSFSYEPKKETIKRFRAIKQAVKEVDAIIIGTDPDREGEAIAYRILELIPNGLKKIKYRLWANSLTKK